jgi:UDP-N-acetylglucosamine 4,6-dehydratase (inverting)
MNTYAATISKIMRRLPSYARLCVCLTITILIISIERKGKYMLDNCSILITGGTGSFGKKFIEMIFERYNPRRIVIYSRDEYKQFEVKNMFSTKLTKEQLAKLRFFIGDVRDKERLHRAFKGIDYVIHAAAMKQVPACEYNPFEAIKTNIHGAQNIVDAALDRGVKKVVALSTDKAVNPINLYGGTKLVSDKLFVSANAYSGDSGTVFSVVRYGNVAGSRGSVIPFFKQLIDKGVAEMPITDFRMTRFWITLEEGVELVFKALEESKGGETYISKIPSFRITDLAKALIPNCELKEVGIREGEKLHEVMVTKDDSRMTYEYKKHYIIYPHFDWWNASKHFTNGGMRVDEGFEYDSGTNSEWLEVEELKEKIQTLSLNI